LRGFHSTILCWAVEVVIRHIFCGNWLLNILSVELLLSENACHSILFLINYKHFYKVLLFISLLPFKNRPDRIKQNFLFLILTFPD
jgi:hypothetical protein